MKYYRDIRNSIDTAVDENTVKIAKNLLVAGISIDTIEQSTGLSKEEIEEIQNIGD